MAGRKRTRPEQGAPKVGRRPGVGVQAVAHQALWSLRRLEPTAARLMLLESAIVQALVLELAEAEARRKGLARAPKVRRVLGRLARGVRRLLATAGAA